MGAVQLTANLGIIGGADGPTVILVSSKPAPGMWILGAAAVAAVLAAVVCALYIARKRRG